MEKKLEIGDRSVSIASSGSQEGSGEILVDDRPCAASFESPARGQLLMDVDGRRVNAFVTRTADGLWVWIDGQARLVREAAPRRRGPGGGAGPQVTPPMPAVVVQVLVVLGQEVAKDQPLVVLSAMKMETTLVAPHAGTVSQVRVQAGAKVAPGDELVQIDAAEEAADA